jgi:CBS domain containing-hemolysin-like protein
VNEFVIPLIIIALLILLNGLFVAAEFSIVGAPKTRIAQKAASGSNSAERVLKVLNDPDKQNLYLATAQVGVTIASLGLGMYGEHTIADWLVGPLHGLGRLALPAAHTISGILSIGLLTYIHVVVGEMVPKSIALQSAETTSVRLQHPMAIMEKIFLPIIVTLNAIGNGVVKLMGIQPAEAQARLMSPDELEFIVDESFAGGLIEENEQLFLENIFDLSERTVGQIMTPRTRIIGIPATTGEDAVLRRVCQSRFTRYPVYDGNLDQIVGILHSKDLARHQVHSANAFDLKKLVRTAIFVPESLSLEHMLIRFRKEGIQMAIVFDEFGGTAGLVTTEDLVEEVVGEILDEFDQEIPPIQLLGPTLLRVRGDLLLDELNQHFDLNLIHPDADTVGGLLMASLGRVLHPGDNVDIDGIHFEVETVTGLAVQTVFVHLPHEAEKPLTPDGSELP